MKAARSLRWSLAIFSIPPARILKLGLLIAIRARAPARAILMMMTRTLKKKARAPLPSTRRHLFLRATSQKPLLPLLRVVLLTPPPLPRPLAMSPVLTWSLLLPQVLLLVLRSLTRRLPELGAHLSFLFSSTKQCVKFKCA